MTKMKVGLQLYTLRDELERDFEQTLRRVAELGYEGVEFAGYYGYDPERLRELMDGLSLKTVSTHVNVNRLRHHLDEELAMSAALGNRFAVCPGITASERMPLPEAAAFFEACGTRFAEQGITFGFHNHWIEFTETYEDERWFDAFFGRVSPGFMKSELDVCWVAHGGCDPVAYIRKYAGRVPLIHLKDMRKSPAGEVETVELGRGDMDLPAVLAASEAAGTEWLIVEQDDCAGPALESVRVSREWLRERGY
ncbi:sugar phosphate isomerase/epimerase family protein [Cohnella hashimotonis]|uniref:Sugar phosphate isomerase/epimerase n=1 Tax=Cohnella hashimotonis TaxID=2826895 RepID=A0ABT6TDZ8_9BACL|nr:sugar phosphate isomerase/epimerase [Cohnella hashimotonis]MDI4644558.1 sugar phosphate isomerase/epimerase [Cohnella hashimotonis]